MKRIKHSKQLNIIGSNVRKARRNAKLSQREVSEKLELQAVYICRGSLSRLEHGRRAVTDLEINAISNCYKCNVIVYQDHRPNIELQNFPKENRVIRLAYFGSCHYNSVRGKSQIALSDHSTEGNIVIRKEEPSPSKQAADTSKSTSNLKSSELKKFAQLHDQKGIPKRLHFIHLRPFLLQYAWRQYAEDLPYVSYQSRHLICLSRLMR